MRAVSLIKYRVVYIHVAADWADIFDTSTKQEKTYIKPSSTLLHTVFRKHVIQPGNRSKPLGLNLSLNVPQHSCSHSEKAAPVPVPPKEYNTLMRAIPVGLTQLIKSHLKFSKGNSVYPALCLGGINFLDRKCNNRHIRKIFQTKRKITPRGKFYWGFSTSTK